MNTQNSLLEQSDAPIKWWREQSVWIMFLLGFSAGIPILLIFSSLSLWLREAGVEKSSVTFFSWAALGYSFKFVWAPLVDRIPIPLLSILIGRRRGWLLVSQLAVISAICLMALSNPQEGLVTMALAAIFLGFSSATQDVVIDAFRIESANSRLQAFLASTYLTGYRLAMIFAGAGALYLAQYFGSTKEVYSYDAWRDTYLCMAAVMSVGLITTLCISEPVRDNNESDYPYSTQDYLTFFVVFCVSITAFIGVFWLIPSAPSLFKGGLQTVFNFTYKTLTMALGLASAYGVALMSLKLKLVNRDMVVEGYVSPIKDFFARYGKLAIWVLLLVGFYKVSDIVLGIIANVFYQDMGYSKIDIANVTKVFGVIVTITGGFLGGLLAIRVGVMRALMSGAILMVITNLAFMWLANVGGNFTYFDIPVPTFSLSTDTSFFAWSSVAFPKELTVVIILDNLAQGISLIAFIAWLSSLTNVSFTATQYAIFSSLMTLFPKVLGGFSGTIVEHIGYNSFFLFASALGLPVILLIAYLSPKLELK